MKLAITYLFMLFGLSGCAGSQLQTEWKEKRGYSQEDEKLIMDQYQEYNQLLAQAQVSSNAFNSSPINNAESRLKSIFCACTKKLGDKCRKKPDGLAGADKDMWVKANAVDLAFVAKHTALDPGPAYKIDPLECM